MSKMSNLALEVAELLHNGNSVDEIAEIVGVPVDWVLSVQETMDDYIMENDYDDGQPDEAQEWYDYDPDC